MSITLVDRGQVAICTNGVASNRIDYACIEGEGASDQRLVVIADFDKHHRFIFKCNHFFAGWAHSMQGARRLAIAFHAMGTGVVLYTHAPLPADLLLISGSRNHFKAAEDHAPIGEKVDGTTALQLGTIEQVINVAFVDPAIFKHGLIANARGVIGNQVRKLRHFHGGRSEWKHAALPLTWRAV